MKYLYLFLLIVVSNITLSAQDSLLIELMRENTYPFQFKDGQINGKGNTFLVDQSQQNSFFLIGEAHGLREIPLFTAALFTTFKHQGYDYFATETGPYTATLIQEKANQKEWFNAFQSHFRQYPMSIPFYSYQEECEILQAVIKDEQRDRELIWGLDQEFAASFRMFFKKLELEAKDEEAKKIAAEYYLLAEKSFAEALETKNPGKSILAIIQPADFEKLKSAFSQQPDALALINELEVSIDIYQKWFKRQGYESNCQRAELMKEHFIAYYNRAKARDKNPKVMFKFGANHMYRGLNALNVFDIGNFVSELASLEGTSSFHLYVLGRKGTQNTYTPFSKSEDDKKAPYDPSTYLDEIDFNPALQAAPTNEWAIIDVRPIRKFIWNNKLKNVHKGLEKVIWSYDALLIIPEVNASTYFD